MAENWAITVGINHYSYLPTLRYGMSDADAMHRLLKEELEFHKIYHFTDKSPPIPADDGPALPSQPTLTTLRRFLRERFREKFLSTGDNLWFFFAGHGFRYQDRDYLMPMDGDRNDVEQSGISLHYVTERLQRSGADNIILLIDACRNSEGRRDILSFGEEKQKGVITLYACSPGQPSYEIEELRGGAFTCALIRSLRIQGEGNCATVERLCQSLHSLVPQLTLRYKGDAQNPCNSVEPISKSHLILLPRQATLADVTVLKNDALSAEIERDFKTARHLWIRVLSVIPADPDAILGIERLSKGTPLRKSSLLLDTLRIIGSTLSAFTSMRQTTQPARTSRRSLAQVPYLDVESATRTQPSSSSFKKAIKGLRREKGVHRATKTTFVRSKVQLPWILTISLVGLLVCAGLIGLSTWTLTNISSDDTAITDENIELDQRTSQLPSLASPISILILREDIDSDNLDKSFDGWLLARLDTELEKLFLLSIPSNTRTNVNGTITAISDARENDTFDLPVQTLSELLGGVYIDKSVAFDHAGIANLIDYIDGVTVSLTSSIYVGLAEAPISLKPGTQNLTSEQVLKVMK